VLCDPSFRFEYERLCDLSDDDLPKAISKRGRKLDPKQIIYVPFLYSHEVTEFSGRAIPNNLAKGELAAVIEKNGELKLEKITDLTSLLESNNPNTLDEPPKINVVALGYASAFEKGFPVITFENARDSAMAFTYRTRGPSFSFEERILKQSKKLSDRAKEKGKNFVAAHDLHDFGCAQLRCSPEELYNDIKPTVEKYFGHSAFSKCKHGGPYLFLSDNPLSALEKSTSFKNLDLR
jgi:hypothetical protein